MKSLLVAMAMGRSFAAVAQQDLITLPVGELDAREVFETIEAQTSYKFMINQSRFDRALSVRVTQSQMTMSALLGKLFSGTGLTYAMDGNYIVVPVTAPEQPSTVVRAVEPKGRVLGIVTDSETKQGVAGAEVILLGVGHRTLSGPEGRFELGDLRPGNYAVKLHFPQLDTVIYRELLVRGGTTTQQDLTVSLPRRVASAKVTTTIIPAARNLPAIEEPVPQKPTHVLAVVPTYDKEPSSYRPKVALKSDLIYLSTLSPNLSLEVGLGSRWTLDITAGMSTGEIGGNDRGIRHALVRPEFRYWFGSAFERHFIGLHGIYGKYQLVDIDFLPLKHLAGKQYEGWGAGIGLSYGYHLPVSARWAFEFSVGVGYMQLDYKDFKNHMSDRFTWGKDKHYFGLTKASISLVLMIK